MGRVPRDPAAVVPRQPRRVRLDLRRGSSQSEPAWRDWAAGRWRGGTAAALAGRDPTGAVVRTATGAEFEAEPGVAHLYATRACARRRGRRLGRGRGCGRLVLSVTETNRRDRGFSEACGFADTGERRPLRDGSDLDVLIFAMTLEDRHASRP